MDKKKNKKSKVSPLGDYDLSDHANDGFEMDHVENNKNISKNNAVDKMRNSAKKVDAFNAILDAKKNASKWRNYCAEKRTIKRTTNITGTLTRSHKENNKKSSPGFLGDDNQDQGKAGGKGLGDIHLNYTKDAIQEGTTWKRSSAASNQALLAYFAKLGHTETKSDVTLDMDFVESLVKKGANINTTDQHGQTLLHEVARTWHVDVAKFLISLGADVNRADSFGRTPLHVAAAVDYPEMVQFLIENNADKEAETDGEKQTPVHYAAKNDACKSLRMLIKLDCKFDTVRDFKGRTPLHIAAELDRSESARLLLEQNARAGVMDTDGNKALSWMITKMPPVAILALDQFHKKDRANRKQEYYLQQLVQDRDLDPKGEVQTPVQVAVSHKQYDLLMHKVFKKLLDEQWVRFARWRAWLNLFLNFVHILLWSVIGIVVEYDERHMYNFPQDTWRIILLIAACCFTAYQFIEEIVEYRRSTQKNLIWVEKRTKSIEQDLRYCHPRWPEEEQFLNEEMERLKERGSSYFKDYWNVFDWVCYVFLLVSIFTHIADIAAHQYAPELARQHIRIMAVTIILLWIRLMKVARAFSLFGPFIVILSHMIMDLVRFLFLYLVFYFPFVCAFWMMFGGNKVAFSDVGDSSAAENFTVSGYEDFGSVFFSLFRLTVVDDYDYDGMKTVDPIMANVLVGFWIAISAILMLNLFIALLSDTFQRVYDNAQSNAVMQKAITILSFWDGMSKQKRDNFLEYIFINANPAREYYDDDMTEIGDEQDLKKVTVQIKDQLDDMQELFEIKFRTPTGMDEDYGNNVTNEKFEDEIHELKGAIKDLQDQQNNILEKFTSDFTVLKNILIEVLGNTRGDGGDGSAMLGESAGYPEFGESRQSTRSRSRTKKKKKKSTMSSEIDPALTDTPVSVSSVRPSGLTTTPMVDVSTADFSASTVPQMAMHSDSTWSRRYSQTPGQDPSSEC